MDAVNSVIFLVNLVSFWTLCFGEDLQFRMSEENVPMTHVGNIMDAAGLQGQGLKYFLMNQGNEYETYFSVGETSGNLTAVDTIDREQLCEFMLDCELMLEVAAQSATNAEFFTLIRVLVIIVDVNDHRPEFPKYSQDLQISEDVLTGATVTIDGARDRDTSAVFSIQSYELVPVNPGENLPFDLSFSKNLDGSSIVKLKVTRHLNREEKDKYAMYVVAIDGGSPPLNGSLYVNVTITDINDNYPTFEQASYNVTVSEEVGVNTIIETVKAYDLDIGLNGEVKYRLSPHQQAENIDHFVIDSVTGDLKVTKILNYNTKSFYKLIVEAIDKGDVPLTTQTFVYVNVKDTGNNPPEIYVNTLPSGEYAEVTEYANVGAVVAYVAIVDNDRGGNGEVTCDVSHSKFGIQRYIEDEYKVILLSSLDRERNEYHTVTVECSDKGNPPLKSTETFIVNVLDENDNPPKFIQQRYFTVIDEKNKIGDELTTVSAYDFDIGNNSKIRYSVAPLSSMYAYVNPNTGVVMANKVFDKESEEGYGLSLTVYAIDHGSPRLTGTTTVLVTINDVNDQPPVFVQSIFRFWIDENRPSDTYVGKIKANDTDRGINADTIYSVKATGADVPFVIFSDGTIKTNRELDREFKSEYIFTVKAVDAGNRSMSSEATVKVFVEDLNDNKPIIYLPTPGNDTVFVPYMTSTDSLIYTVIATDFDDPLSFNSKISYELKTPNKTNYFTIDASSGDIFLSAPLSNADLINRVFLLNITVKDYGEGLKASSANLHVVITASNVTDVILRDAEYEKNVLIVIVVASVTFVISVAILVTIFILRRIDIQRKESNARLKVLNENMYYKGTDKVDNLTELPIDINYTEKSKKEVSFSLDEDHVLVNKPFQRNNSLEHILLEPPPQYKYDGSKGKLDDSQSDMSRDSGGDSGKGGSDDDIQREVSEIKYRDPRFQKRSKLQGSFSMNHTRYTPDIGVPAHEMTSFPFQTSLRHPSPITTYGVPMYYADDQQTSSSFNSGDSCASLVPNNHRPGKLTMNLRDNMPRDCVV